MIQVAKYHSTLDPVTTGIDYRCATIEEIASTDEKFDVVCCSEVIEHVERPLTFLKHVTSVLKPGGSLILTTMNRTPKSYMVAIVGAEYALQLVPPGL